MPLTKEQLKALDECVKDELGQPLTCYGCMGAAAPSKEHPQTLFPGLSVEWVCLNCIRNPNREEFWKKHGQDARAKRQAEHELLKDPADMYHTSDYEKQHKFWDL